jgi:type VI secretion system VasD/TssJ family lipoprotein
LKYYFNALFLLVIISLFCACSRPLPPPEWLYEKEAIRINIKADTNLNEHRGMSHPLHSCVYQLKDLNAFVKLTGYEDGLRELLDYRCAIFDASAATPVDVQPEQELTLTLDRAEGAKYVAIAAGYYELSKDRTIRWIEIPVVTEKKGFIKRKKIQKPGHLNIEIILGPKQIQTFKGKQ